MSLVSPATGIALGLVYPHRNTSPHLHDLVTVPHDLAEPDLLI